jgi:hypothetical protein
VQPFVATSEAVTRLLFTSPILAAGGSQIVPFSPKSSGLPGSTIIENLADGIGWWALVASLVALVLGAAAWALGSHTNNYQYSSAGRRAVIVAGAAALVIGAAPTLVTFLFDEGQKI